MKKNERHQELIIKSSFPALQVPEKDSYLRRARRRAAGCHGAVGAGSRPRLTASYSIPGNWDQMLPLSGTWTGSNLEAFILWRRCLVKPCSRSKWASVRLWWWIWLVKALKAGSWLLPSPRIRLQISTLPVQLWNEPIQLTERRYACRRGASCVISDGVSDRATQRWVLKTPTRYHLLNLLEEAADYKGGPTSSGVSWWSTYRQWWT